ncbi:MAG: hypothetical protein NW241_06730 [Bacteroidia bacterium]|nr:hypothetical protein [Bacteroidia bacterium]
MSIYKHSQNDFSSTFCDPQEWQKLQFKQPGDSPVQSEPGSTDKTGAQAYRIKIRIYDSCIVPDFGEDIPNLPSQGEAEARYEEMNWDIEDDSDTDADLKGQISQLEWAILHPRHHREEGLYRVFPDWDESNLEVQELDRTTLQAWIQTGGPILLMIHGTLGSVQVAFDDLFFGNGNNRNAIRGLISTRYQGRILCFEHCTLTQSVEGNVNLFYKELHSILPEGGISRLQIDVLTRSRGALVAREMMYREACKHSDNPAHHTYAGYAGQIRQIDSEIQALNEQKAGLQGPNRRKVREQLEEINQKLEQLETKRDAIPVYGERVRLNIGTVVMIAPPNRGTMVSNSAYGKLSVLRSAIFSLLFVFSILRIGQKEYFKSVARMMILLIRLSLRNRRGSEEVLRAIVPGMIDMTIGSDCVTRLHTSEKELAGSDSSFYSQIRLMAIAGNYNPSGEYLIPVIHNLVRDNLFRNAANDLVVPTTEEDILHLGFRQGNEHRICMHYIEKGPPHTQYFDSRFIADELQGIHHDTPLWQMLDRPDTTLASLNGGTQPPIT